MIPTLIVGFIALCSLFLNFYLIRICKDSKKTLLEMGVDLYGNNDTRND